MTTSVCVHFWQIETAEGPVSVGVCKLCRASREFSNSMEDKTVYRWQTMDWLRKRECASDLEGAG